MSIKWNFRNEPSQDFSVVPVFAYKSFLKPLLGHRNMDALLSQREN